MMVLDNPYEKVIQLPSKGVTTHGLRTTGLGDYYHFEHCLAQNSQKSVYQAPPPQVLESKA